MLHKSVRMFAESFSIVQSSVHTFVRNFYSLKRSFMRPDTVLVRIEVYTACL